MGLNDQMEFDSPVRINEDGSVESVYGEGIYAPSVYAYEGMDGDPDIDGSGWSFWSRGYTGQYGVKRTDPIMHASEFIGGRLEQDLLSEPGVYVVTTVEDIDDPDGPWGWTILQKDASKTSSREAAHQFTVEELTGETEFPILLFDNQGNVFDRAGNLATAETVIAENWDTIVGWYVPEQGTGHVRGTGISKADAEEYLQWVLDTNKDLWSNPVSASRKTALSGEEYDLIICYDCYATLANGGDYGPDGKWYLDGSDTPSTEDPLSLLPDSWHVLPGDQYAEFSSYRCDGCGTGLAGARYTAKGIDPTTASKKTSSLEPYEVDGVWVQEQDDGTFATSVTRDGPFIVSPVSDAAWSEEGAVRAHQFYYPTAAKKTAKKPPQMKGDWKAPGSQWDEADGEDGKDYDKGEQMRDDNGRFAARKNVTKADAEKLLAALRENKGYGPDDKYGPTLMQDWDFMGYGNPAPWSIVWEEGPYDWAYSFPHGGVDPEFGFRVKPVDVPSHIFVEPITSWAVGLFPSGVTSSKVTSTCPSCDADNSMVSMAQFRTSHLKVAQARAITMHATASGKSTDDMVVCSNCNQAFEKTALPGDTGDKPAGAAPQVPTEGLDPEPMYDPDEIEGQGHDNHPDATNPNTKTAMPAPADVGVDVGTIFYTSWGYDQTNVDFYEVVGLTPKSVKVRRLNKSVEYKGSGSNEVSPIPGSYDGGEFTARLLEGGFNSSTSIKVDYGQYAWPWDGTPRHETASGWGH